MYISIGIIITALLLLYVYIEDNKKTADKRSKMMSVQNDTIEMMRREEKNKNTANEVIDAIINIERKSIINISRRQSIEKLDIKIAGTTFDVIYHLSKLSLHPDRPSDITILESMNNSDLEIWYNKDKLKFTDIANIGSAQIVDAYVKLKTKSESAD